MAANCRSSSVASLPSVVSAVLVDRQHIRVGGCRFLHRIPCTGNGLAGSYLAQRLAEMLRVHERDRCSTSGIMIRAIEYHVILSMRQMAGPSLSVLERP